MLQLAITHATSLCGVSPKRSFTKAHAVPSVLFASKVYLQCDPHQHPQAFWLRLRTPWLAGDSRRNASKHPSAVDFTNGFPTCKSTSVTSHVCAEPPQNATGDHLRSPREAETVQGYAGMLAESIERMWSRAHRGFCPPQSEANPYNEHPSEDEHGRLRQSHGLHRSSLRALHECRSRCTLCQEGGRQLCKRSQSLASELELVHSVVVHVRPIGFATKEVKRTVRLVEHQTLPVAVDRCVAGVDGCPLVALGIKYPGISVAFTAGDAERTSV